MSIFLERARELEATVIADRRALHQIPETGVYLPKTVEYVKNRLDELGIEYKDCGYHDPADRETQRKAGNGDMPEATGIVGIIGSGSPCILIRADMDALPMKEESGLPFAATGDATHSCGHDAHTAMLLGAAKILKDMEADLPGTIKLMFQPGEELGYGAKTMVQDGLLENPHVDVAIALHVESLQKTATLEYFETDAYAGCATFRFDIHGVGGHSSQPQTTIDPLNCAYQIANALNLIIPLETDPEVFATLNVGVVHGGTAGNIIPSEARVDAMIRTFDMDIFNHLCKRMPEIAENYAKAWRCTVDTIAYKTPAAINDPELVRELIPSFQSVFGEENVRKRKRDKGGEDFGYVANEVPGAYFVIGTEDPEHHSLHHPGVLIDEDGYVYGTAVLAECAYNWLKEHKAGL